MVPGAYKTQAPEDLWKKGVKWYITHTTSGSYIPKENKGDWG